MTRLTSRVAVPALAVPVLALLAACSTAGAGGVPSGPRLSASGEQPAARVVPPDAVVTVRRTGDQRASLELRSGADGRVLSVVLPSLPAHVGVARLSPGALLLSTPDGCRTRLERLDLATGVRTPVRVLDGRAENVTPGPDGRRLAFVTYPACVPPTPSSSAGPFAGPAAYLPNVLAVTPLTGGPVLTTTTDTPGHPVYGIAWSPDGSTIASTYWGDQGDRVLLFAAAAPRFRTAQRLAAAPGCRLSVRSWAAEGLLAIEMCGTRDDADGHGRLVRLTPRGTVAAAWPLPGCVYAVDAAARPGGPGVVMVEHSGYGHGPCGRRRHWADQLVTLDVSSAGTAPMVLHTQPLRFMSSELALVG